MTPEQIAEFRKDFELAWILDEGAYKSSTAKQFYEAGYIHARTKQATEIAELKAKLDEVESKLQGAQIAIEGLMQPTVIFGEPLRFTNNVLKE